MSNQITKSFRDFVGRLWGAARQRDAELPAPPVIPLTIRVGIAGHLHFDRDAELDGAISNIFTALRRYAENANGRYHAVLYGALTASPPSERVHVIGQLASGFDQIAADHALNSGYRLHAVLPGDRETVKRDVEKNAGTDAEVRREAGSAFSRLLERSERVLELDRSGDDEVSATDYAQAASVILDHADLLVVAMHANASTQLGGTVWIEQGARERNLPIVRLSLENMAHSTISWVSKGRREARRLFDPNDNKILPALFSPALDEVLFGAAKGPPPAGCFERAYGSQLTQEMNAAFWNERWDSGAEPACQALTQTRNDIDRDFGAAKIWADHRASAFAEMMRGAFLVSALLGLLAIGAAAAGLIVPAVSVVAKALELTCLLLIVGLAWRSKRFNWRSQWTALRQLERLIDQAAWLNLLGRGRSYAGAGFDKTTDSVTNWADVYLRAIVRSAALPGAQFSENYLLAVHELALKNLVQGQIAYYDSERRFQERAGDVLEWWMAALIGLAATAVTAYLLLHLLLLLLSCSGSQASSVCTELEIFTEHIGPLAGWAGVLFPAIVATLAAIASFGEFQQLASRYDGIHAALEVVESFLVRHRFDDHDGAAITVLSSAILAREIGDATDVLLQEVSGWRALLQIKRIEVV